MLSAVTHFICGTTSLICSNVNSQFQYCYLVCYKDNIFLQAQVNENNCTGTLYIIGYNLHGLNLCSAIWSTTFYYNFTQNTNHQFILYYSSLPAY